MSDQTRSKFALIEFGRGAAASIVVLHHAGSFMAQPHLFGVEPLNGLFRNFNVGVDFFFVLSGFIIAWVHHDDIGRAGRTGSYARKRFLRIYPPYWGILFPLVLYYALAPGAGSPEQSDPINTVLSIGLLPYTSQPVLGVAWTLTHEIFFYAVFAAVIVCGRRALWALPVWAVAIVAAHVLFDGLPFPLSFLLSPFNLEFLMGVGAALLLRARRLPMPWVLAAAGLVAFVLLMVFAPNIQDDMLVGRLAFGSAAALFVFGVVEGERSRRTPLPLPPALAYFGAASYAVYLVHPIALLLLLRVVRKLGGLGLGPDVLVFVVTAGAILFGSLYHSMVEWRLVALARRVLSYVGGDRSATQTAR